MLGLDVKPLFSSYAPWRLSASRSPSWKIRHRKVVRSPFQFATPDGLLTKYFLFGADIDPESFESYANDESDGGNSHADGGAQRGFNGREHYEEVATSRLRRPVKPALGKRYASSRITREALIGRNENGGREGSGSGEGDSGVNDPFAPMSEESEEDPFAKGTSTGSESEHALSDISHSEGRKRMKVMSGSLPEEEDEEIDSDDAFGEDDAGKFQGFKFLGSRRARDTTEIGSGEGNDTNMSSSSGKVSGAENAVSEDDSEASSQLSEHDSDEAVDMDVDSEAASELSATSPSSQKVPKSSATNGDRAALKALLSSDTAAVASSLSAAASADAKKGQAVKAQYQTFDRLLDARIKMQKGLMAANSIAVECDFSEHKDAIKAAEEAALSLWNTITSIRHSFTEAQSQTSPPENNKKRKRPIPVTTSTPVSAIWSTTKTPNSLALPHHRTILNKWSAKVRATNPVARESTSRLTSNNATENSITNIIDGHLASESEKLIAQSTAITTNSSTPSAPPPSRSRTNPNSNSNPDPTLLANPDPSRALTYDDSPFYQTLLRDLITSRSSLNPTIPNPSDLFPTNNRLHPPGSAHKRGQIDTKASKGRKVRYTVNEKLQNFMAAEGFGGSGRGGGGLVGSGWSEEARNEFFASLLGGGGFLHEEEGSGSDGDGKGEGEGEVEALRLFRG